MIPRWVVRGIALAFFLLVACSTPTSPATGVEEIEPWPSWEAAFPPLSECIRGLNEPTTNLDTRFSDYTWAVADNLNHPHRPNAGAYLFNGRHVVIRRSRYELMESGAIPDRGISTIVHEMIHRFLPEHLPNYGHDHEAYDRCQAWDLGVGYYGQNTISTDKDL